MSQVKQRHLLYVSGFDPRGASTYHRMMKDAFAHHCNSRNLNGEFGARRRAYKEIHEWETRVRGEASDIVCKFSFLDWGTMVRQFWTRPDFKATLIGAWAALRLFGCGMPQQMYRLSHPILLTNISPLTSVVAWGLVASVLMASTLIAVFVSSLWGAILTCVTLVFTLILFNFLKRFNIAWIGRINHFLINAAKTKLLNDWNKPDEMADALLAALRDETNDEVLFVSHSIGTNVAVLALARAILKGEELIISAVKNGRLVFVTLGQTIPTLAPSSTIMTDALKTLSQSEIPWLDVSAPADPACYVLTDPCVAVLGSAPRVHLKNAQFHKNFSTKTYNAAKMDRFVMHFLYLYAPDSGTEPSFDFYEFMTAPTRVASQLDSQIKQVTPFFAKKGSKASI